MNAVGYVWVFLILASLHSYESAELSTDEREQVGFSAARVSSDRRLVGWLALTPNCCTSYPIPTVLVVMKQGKIVRRFEGELPIFRWAFARRDTAVAYQMGQVHGCTGVDYRLRRISDGAVLARYSCSCDRQPPAARVPAWVWPVAWGCPESAEGSSPPSGPAPNPASQRTRQKRRAAELENRWAEKSIALTEETLP